MRRWRDRIAAAIVAAQPARQLDRRGRRSRERLQQRARHAPVAGRDRMVGRLQGRVERHRPPHAAARPPDRARPAGAPQAGRCRPPCRTRLQHAAPRRAAEAQPRRADRAISRASAAASACGSSGGTSRPLTPSSISSGTAATRLATTASSWRPPRAARSAGRRGRRRRRSGCQHEQVGRAIGVQHLVLRPARRARRSAPARPSARRLAASSRRSGPPPMCS